MTCVAISPIRMVWDKREDTSRRDAGTGRRTDQGTSDIQPARYKHRLITVSSLYWVGTVL
jgi:hypothetical protein